MLFLEFFGLKEICRNTCCTTPESSPFMLRLIILSTF